MANPATYKRPAFQRRPWITGATYDLYSSKALLHCDAYTWTRSGLAYLQLVWTEGGHTVRAHEWYLIEADGLTPLWDVIDTRDALPVFWTARNNAMMGRIHARVVLEAHSVRFNRWARVVLQAHYVLATDRSYEPAGNTWEPHAPRSRAVRGALPDVL